jgi:hypothetical protein
MMILELKVMSYELRGKRYEVNSKSSEQEPFLEESKCDIHNICCQH